MFFFLKKIKHNILFNLNHSLGVLILSFYPVTFFLGTGLLNLFVVLIDMIFLYEIIKKKKYFFFNNFVFYNLIFLWLVFLINLVFSIDVQNSLGRTIGFLRYIIFVMAIIYFMNVYNQKYLRIILSSWSLIFLTINFDLIYEFIFGKNILGFESYMPGRLASFFNDELKIGHLYMGFCLIILSYFINFLINNRNNFERIKTSQEILIIFFILLIIIISFLIGERSNFIKTLIMLFGFLFYFKLISNKKKLFLISTTLVILFIILNYNQNYKKRFFNQFLTPMQKNLISYLNETNYIEHYKFGIEIFKDNKLFGVGLKNYRIESTNRAKFTEHNWVNSSIHPHQVHIEILSELGIVGYIGFIVFFILSFINFRKNLDINNRYFKIAGLFFVITSFLPLLPSGSFFTSHAATIFWMNYALMSFQNKKFKY